VSVAELGARPALPERLRLGEAVDRTNHLMRAAAGNLRFRLEQDKDQARVGVIDSGSGALMRHIPSDEMLAIAKALDRMQGLMVNLKV